MKIRNILFATSMLCAFSGVAMANEFEAPPAQGGTSGQMGDQHFARVDSNHDGVLTREEARAAHSAQFVAIDADRDGFLTREEMRTHHATQVREVRVRVQSRAQERHMSTLDANNDGNISRQEWNSARQRMEEQKEKARLDRFNTLDTNRDGQLSRAEMEAGQRGQHGMQHGGQNRQGPPNAGVTERPMPPRQRPPNPDTNNDSKISRAEWDAMPLRMFDDGDLNHDGRVTREEAAQAMRGMHHGQGHRPNRGQMFHSPPGGGN